MISFYLFGVKLWIAREKGTIESNTINVTFITPIITITAHDDPYVLEDDTKGWKKFTSREYYHWSVLGDHFSVLESPKSLLQMMSDYLREACGWWAVLCCQLYFLFVCFWLANNTKTYPMFHLLYLIKDMFLQFE